MRSVCVLFALLLLGLIPSAASAQDGTSSPPNPGGSSAIEQALIEHACLSQLPGIAGADKYQDCLSARLRVLRADFGRDLSRVSVAERKTLDSACSAARAAEGREAYLECLTVQLVAVRNRRTPNPQESEATAVLPLGDAQPATLANPDTKTSPSLSPAWIGVGVVTLVAAIGGAFLAVKGRRVPRTCRVCGEGVPQGGDLCPKCRHEAAEALRQARADQELAHADEQQRQRPREDAFDPHAILGVPRDAGKEVIEAAHQQGQLKYALEQVAHLGPELQEHYKRKAEAVERAYRILTK